MNVDTLVRAVKTFFQTFVAAIVLPATDAFNLAAWKATVLAAAAAAASAVWNGVVSPILAKAKAKK